MSTKIYMCDIECFPNLFLCGLKYDKNDYEIIEISSRRDERYKLVERLEEDAYFIGFNNHHYDDVVLRYFYYHFGQFKPLSGEKLAEELFYFGKDVIDKQIPYHKLKIYQYPKPNKRVFKSIDLMSLIQVGKQRPKGLKNIAINLKHPLILECELPWDEPVAEEDMDIVYPYNINDLDITDRLYLDQLDNIRLRVQIQKKYGIECLSDQDSKIADKIIRKGYATVLGINHWDIPREGTFRSSVKGTDVVADNIHFKGNNLKELVRQIKSSRLDASEEFKFEVRVGETVYHILKGGLHSVHDYKNNKGRIVGRKIWTPDEKGEIWDCDVASYYPNLILNLQLCPEHLNKDVFLQIYGGIVQDRIEAKRLSKSKDLNIAAEAEIRKDVLKIAVNGISGKFGDEHSWLYDVKCTYRMTISGQLYLLMLVEALEDHGISVFYANTDGITAYVPKNKRDVYIQICAAWEKHTGLDLEFLELRKLVINNVNSILAIPKDPNKPVKAKKDLDRDLWKDVKKGFNMPIVAHAIHEYFVNGTPLEDTIHNHPDILDYCTTQNIGPKFKVIQITGGTERKEIQRVNRYVITNSGVTIEKESRKDSTRRIRVLAGQYVTLVNDINNLQKVDIKYDYYLHKAKEITTLLESDQLTLW